MEDFFEDIETIDKALKEAKEYGLEIEVIWSALHSMKTNSNRSIEEAICDGLEEWIK